MYCTTAQPNRPRTARFLPRRVSDAPAFCGGGGVGLGGWGGVAVILRGLHQVEAAVLLHQLLPLAGLHQAVDHGAQRVPVHAEAPPTAALHEAGALLPAADEEGAHLSGAEQSRAALKLVIRPPLEALVCDWSPCRGAR